MANLNKVIYLTEEQKEALFTNGTLTVNGQTITYNDNDIYITMDRTGQGKAHIVNETVTPLATISGLVEGQTYYSGDYFTVSCEQPCSVGISFDKEEHYMELIAYPIKGVSNTYKFQLPELLNDFTIGIVLLGDINKDGEIDLKDSSMVLQYLSNNTSLSALSLLALDLNRNGIIDTDDATLIQQYYSGASSFQWNVINSDIIPVPEKNQAGKILVATNNNKYELQDAPTGGENADWEETDSTENSYIYNKPPIKADNVNKNGIIEGMLEGRYETDLDGYGYRVNANSASGEFAHAEGHGTVASGDYSHAEGNVTIASGNYSHAEGWQTQALGNMSHTEGFATIARGGGHTEGSYTQADRNAHAEGHKTRAIGSCSHAEGYSALSFGNYSHAEGDSTNAIGSFSHAEGQASEKRSSLRILQQDEPTSVYTSQGLTYTYNTSGTADFLVGDYIRSYQGDVAAKVMAIGQNSITLSPSIGNIKSSNPCNIITAGAFGDYSHVEGISTIAASNNQHAQGKFNIADNQNIYADIVGNGVDENHRSNAYTLDWNGNGWFAGTIEASAILLRSSTPNSTKVFRITVDDTGVLTTTEVQ